MPARVRIQYDGDTLILEGWLPQGTAQFCLPRGGGLELSRSGDGSLDVVVRDRHGNSKPMRVEGAA